MKSVLATVAICLSIAGFLVMVLAAALIWLWLHFGPGMR
jgi:hypothetical protein